jgi:hypothetical protein
MSKAKRGNIFHWGEGEDKRPPLTQVMSDLQDVGLLPRRESWWFAWREVEIKLPAQLRNINTLPTDWDVLHIFSRNAEFRQIRRGHSYQWLLLTEKEFPPELLLPRSAPPILGGKLGKGGEDEPKEEKTSNFAKILLFKRDETKEEVEQHGFGHSWENSEQSYQTILSHRIMWGNRLRKPAKEGAGVEEARGVVGFPRPLEYDVAGEGTGNYDKALVADVRLYFDDEARLQTVRYMRIYLLPPGDDSVRMKTFGKVMEEAY